MLEWLALSRELIGAVALGFFWIHTLLIAGAALLDLRDLAAWRRRLRPLTLRPGAVGLARVRGRGKGPHGALAVNRVRQIGRSKGDGRVHFSDAAHESEIFAGGEIELDGATVEVAGVTGSQASVWPDLQARAQAAAAVDDAQIEAAIPEARRARGFARVVEVWLGESEAQGQEQPTMLWVAGRLEQGDEGWRLVADGDAPILLAANDPRSWIRRKQALVLGFVAGELLLAGACTVLALWPPLFDWVSMLGAAAALGFFLGVQPVGVTVNEAVRTPDRAYLRGLWRVGARA